MMNPDNIKALAFDLDGTLLAPGAVLSERTINAVSDCMRRGIRIIIATGRAPVTTEAFRAALNAEGPMIYFNGALVADMPKNEILSAIMLDIKTAEYCLDISREIDMYYQVYFPVYNEDPNIVLMAEKDYPEREMYHKNTGMMSELGDLKKALSRPGLSGCVKAMFLSEPELLDSLRLRLEKHFGKSVYLVKSHPSYLEILNKEVSKGEGLKVAMKHYSLKKEEVIVFGDEENDLPMFEAAGFSVAPSNAKDTVKARAGAVTRSNADDGVASFLEEFFGM